MRRRFRVKAWYLWLSDSSSAGKHNLSEMNTVRRAPSARKFTLLYRMVVERNPKMCTGGVLLTLGRHLQPRCAASSRITSVGPCVAGKPPQSWCYSQSWQLQQQGCLTEAAECKLSKYQEPVDACQMSGWELHYDMNLLRWDVEAWLTRDPRSFFIYFFLGGGFLCSAQMRE